MQSVGTNGRIFHFVVFQLNTTELTSDSGVKNLAWIDGDQPLYDFAKVRPFIKKKVVRVRERFRRVLSIPFAFHFHIVTLTISQHSIKNTRKSGSLEA